MAMPRRDGTIEAIKRAAFARALPPPRERYGGQDGAPGALLEYAVMHGD